MDPATLAAFAGFVASVAPALLETITKLIADFKAVHPALGEPPPADGEGAVDAAVDAEVKDQFDKP